MSLTRCRVNYSPEELLRAFPNHHLRVDRTHKKIFCNLCKVLISRAETYEVRTHCNTVKHVRARTRHSIIDRISAEDNVYGNFSQVQREREEFLDDLIILVVNLNASFRCFDQPYFVNFFLKYCKNNLGYSLPKSTMMRERLKVLFVNQKQQLKEKLREQHALHLLVDETTDSRSKPILNILVQYFDYQSDKLKQALLKSVEIVSVQNGQEQSEPANGQSVAFLVHSTLVEYELRAEQVFTFATDNASYMKAAYRILFNQYRYKFLQHITCYSHILHLVCKDILQKFPAVRELISVVKR